MRSKKTILVTGGCGFIGTNLIDYLLNKNSSPLWWAVFILKLLKRCKFAERKQAIQHVIIRFKCNLTSRWSIPIEN